MSEKIERDRRRSHVQRFVHVYSVIVSTMAVLIAWSR
jgi:hypothetical protein